MVALPYGVPRSAPPTLTSEFVAKHACNTCGPKNKFLIATYINVRPKTEPETLSALYPRACSEGPHFAPVSCSSRGSTLHSRWSGT